MEPERGRGSSQRGLTGLEHFPASAPLAPGHFSAVHLLQSALQAPAQPSVRAASKQLAPNDAASTTMELKAPHGPSLTTLPLASAGILTTGATMQASPVASSAARSGGILSPAAAWLVQGIDREIDRNELHRNVIRTVPKSFRDEFEGPRAGGGGAGGVRAWVIQATRAQRVCAYNVITLLYGVCDGRPRVKKKWCHHSRSRLRVSRHPRTRAAGG